MKYFAKYLPVEGKITDGENVMFKIDGEWTEPCSFDSFIGAGIQAVMQGKLFLCTREIQLGDEVYYKGNKHIVIHKEENSDWLFIDPDPGPSIDPKELTKVIGEISPDSLGDVREGDEFDLEDLEKIVYDGTLHHVTWDSSPPVHYVRIRKT